jgi:hypothetical protein
VHFKDWSQQLHFTHEFILLGKEVYTRMHVQIKRSSAWQEESKEKLDMVIDITADSGSNTTNISPVTMSTTKTLSSTSIKHCIKGKQGWSCWN